MDFKNLLPTRDPARIVGDIRAWLERYRETLESILA
jgi:hypothetical protein